MPFNWFPQTAPPFALRFRLDYDLSCQAEQLRATYQDTKGDHFVPAVSWEPHELGRHIPPLLSQDDREGGRQFQALFDALWATGYRPAQAARQDSVIEVKNEVIAAKDAHLGDLRHVVQRFMRKV